MKGVSAGKTSNVTPCHLHVTFSQTCHTLSSDAMILIIGQDLEVSSFSEIGFNLSQELRVCPDFSLSLSDDG